jgi:hypothetical protein
MLILVWTVLCDLFRSYLLIIVIVNTSFFVVFTSLAFIIATLPNIFICRKREIDEDHQPKSSKLVDCWRFSRESSITIVFCSVAKNTALCLSLITALVELFFYLLDSDMPQDLSIAHDFLGQDSARKSCA